MISFDPVRYHLDEHINDAIADALRLAGLDVTTTVEQRLKGATHGDHLITASKERRTIVTDDADFQGFITPVKRITGSSSACDPRAPSETSFACS